jgi:hypothetical protein
MTLNEIAEYHRNVAHFQRDMAAIAKAAADTLAAAAKVLNADGIVYGDTGDDTEPLEVLRAALVLGVPA